MKQPTTSKVPPKTSTSMLASYISGFVLSLALTFLAYSLVVNHIFAGWGLVASIAGLAGVQLLVQLVFFLHLGNEPKPRLNLIVLLFAVLVIIIVMFGSLWIMHNLDYNMMSPMETETFIREEEGIY